MSITWSYGLTTVPSRFETTLPKTLASLAESGFDYPRLFIDGCKPEKVLDWLKHYEYTCHYPNLRTHGNWIVSLYTLYIYNPTADRYAIFQDDFQCSRNLRPYLDSCEYPREGYWNLYTFPENEPDKRGHSKDKTGWYLSNQKGKGAVALVFDNKTARALLSSEWMVNRPQNKERGWKAVDGGIVTGLAKKGIKEYVHSPSLVQHIGDKSSMGNARHPKAGTYKGNDFNLLNLSSSPPKKVSNIILPESVSKPLPIVPNSRISLIGYNTRSGLGQLNRQLAEHINVSKWLVKPHGKYATQPVDDIDCDIVSCTGCNQAKITQFVANSDVLLFCETPYYSNILDIAKKQRKRTVCVPMLEWMTPGMKGWPQQVDLFLCPTQQAYRSFSHIRPCVYAPWPIDTDRFTFKQRNIVERFLYIEGHGGWGGRKGASVVMEAKKLWPEMPLIVRTQLDKNRWTDLGVAVLGEVADAKDLYNEGDVLLLPHSVDGLSLEPLESLACGMPVISTDGEPWTEYPALAYINATKEKKKVKRPVDWWNPDPQDLATICKRALGQDISTLSISGRQWAEERGWSKLAKQYEEFVIRGGV